MKKFAFAAILFAVALIALAIFDSGVPQRDVEIKLNIAPLTQELAKDFTHVYGFDYALARQVRDGEAVPANGTDIAIWADVPIHNVSLILIGNDFIDDALFLIPFHSFALTDTLMPGMAIVVSSYIGHGTLPWSGISFVDEDGVRHFFAMAEDTSSSADAFMIWPFENKENYTNTDFLSILNMLAVTSTLL